MPKTTHAEQAVVETPVKPAPQIQKRIERGRGGTQPLVRHYPRVIAGTCEYHGTINPNYPGNQQYRLCPNDGKHPNYAELQCSYCEDYKNPEDINYKATLTITDHPTNPYDLVVCCDNFSCLEKHQARFKIS